MRKFKLTEIELTRNQQTVINIVSGVVAVIISMSINFFLSPYIVRTLGATANGFVGLANNFISYTSLITVALNSMANRFISIEYHRGNIKRANQYYSSLFFGDLIIVIVLSICAIVFLFNLEYLLCINSDLVLSVKILFAILFLNTLISTLFTIWNCSTYVVNRLYLNSIRTIQSNILRALVIVGLFCILQPKVYYIGIATLAASTVTNIYNCYYKKVLLPSIKFRKEDIRWDAIKTLIGSGVWNSFSNASTILLTGLDLLITNIFIDSGTMGILSVAKTLPGLISEFSSTITSVFSPSIVIDYAKGDKKKICDNLMQSSKITSVICIIPLGFLICFGDWFYGLWQPTLDAKTLQTLSVLTCMMLAVTAGLQSFYNVFMVTNRVKENSIVIFISALISTVITALLVKYTSLGVYAVAGVSSVVIIIRNLVYTVPFSAKYLGLPWNSFFGVVGKSLLSTVLSCILGFIVRSCFYVSTWGVLIFVAVIYAVLALLVNFLVVLNKNERANVAVKIRSILRKNKNYSK